jgi:hypothetical protein
VRDELEREDGRRAVGWLLRAKNDPIVPVRWTC